MHGLYYLKVLCYKMIFDSNLKAQSHKKAGERASMSISRHALTDPRHRNTIAGKAEFIRRRTMVTAAKSTSW